MGVALSALSEINPLSVVKSSIHDLSVFVLNSCKSDCDCCGCLRFNVQTFPTTDMNSDNDTSLNITWNS